MGSTSKIILLVAAVVVLFLLSGLLYIFTPVRSYQVHTHVKVADYVGFNLDTDKMYFGTIDSGGSTERSLTISSESDNYVLIKPGGEMGSWLYTKDWSFPLKKRTNQDVMVINTIPPNTPYGNYTGTLTVFFYPSYAEWFLD